MKGSKGKAIVTGSSAKTKHYGNRPAGSKSVLAKEGAKLPAPSNRPAASK